MEHRTIGSSELSVAPIGLGCMGLSEFYGPPTDENDAIALLHAAVEQGVNHFDTAEAYGVGSANEQLLGRAFADRRDQVVIATKFGPLRDPDTGAPIGIDGSRSNCRRAIEGSLQRLQTDHVDLYYLHRVDPNTPIEDTVQAMAELVDEGKVRAIGLSEPSADTLRRAAAIHPIAAVESEYSIFSRDIEAEVMPACAELGVSLVAYSPLGRGMLTGAFSADTQLAQTDFRSAMQPRFQGEAYSANLNLVREIETIAEQVSATPAQIALAWVLGRGDDILTIPGTTRLANLQANLGAYEVTLTAEQLQVLGNLADQVRGARYDEAGSARLNG